MPPSSELNTKFTFTIISICLVGAFHHGYHLGIFNIPHEALKQWSQQITKESDITFSWAITVSMFPAGCAIGSLFINMRFGHLRILLYTSIITLVGQTLMNMSKEAASVVMLQIGRYIIGVSAGISAGVATIYFWEVSPDCWRRIIVVFFQFCITLAMIFAQILGLFLMEIDWILLVLIATVPIAIGCVMLKFCRESPKFVLIRKKNEIKAKQYLMWFRNCIDVDPHFEQLKEEMRILEITVNSVWNKRMILCMVAIASEQLCGSSIFLYYSSELFQKLGVGSYATLIMSLTMLSGNAVAAARVNAWGTKVLLLSSLAIMFVSNLFMIVVLLSTKIQTAWVQCLIVTSALFYGFGYGFGVASVRWLMVLENFNFWGRGLVSAFLFPINFTISTAVVLMFLLVHVENRYYMLMPFLFFDVFLFILIIFLTREDGEERNEHNQ